MQTINNVVKWSFYASAIAAMLVLGGIFAVWFTVEVLKFIISISA